MRVAIVTLLLAACGSSATSNVQVVAKEPERTTLGPGDSFEVRVYGEDSLSGKHQVADDGSITFPLVGRVEVVGRAPSEIGRAIEDALRARGILREPTVSVFLLEQTSRRVTVMGAVARPGTVSMRPGMTILDAIGTAGGLTALASGDQTIVSRRVDGKLRRFRVQVEGISEGKASDFPVQAGDIVYVPQRVF